MLILVIMFANVYLSQLMAYQALKQVILIHFRAFRISVHCFFVSLDYRLIAEESRVNLQQAQHET